MKKPNIVFIITDQQRADTIQALGASHMHTPNMDRIFKHGHGFTNAFCPGATCTPSRAAIFTGMYAHNTGCYSFKDWGHQRTWISDLADEGYWCSSVGKMHFGPRDVPGGFHERLIVENPTSVSNWGGNGDDAWGKFLNFHGYERPNYRHRTDPKWSEKFQGIPWHLDENLHSDAFVGDSAASYIRNYSENKPLFLQIGFPGPHEPWDPPQRLIDLYEDRSWPEPIDFDCDIESHPAQHLAIKNFHANCDHESTIQMPEATREDVRHMQQHYFAKISFVDEQIGKVLDALEEKGILEDSILIFTSDHGEMMGDHGMAYKWLMYDSILRVPLAIADFRKNSTGLTHDELVSLIDLGPTVTDLASAVRPTRLEGRSLASYLDSSPAEPPRDTIYSEDNYMICIREERFKMVYYMGQAFGELYDLVEDPNETDNLWDDPKLADEKNRLHLKLLDWLSSSAYHNGEYKCTIDRNGGAYPVRWPSEDNVCLHGSNYRPKIVPHH